MNKPIVGWMTWTDYQMFINEQPKGGFKWEFVDFKPSENHHLKDFNTPVFIYTKKQNKTELEEIQRIKAENARYREALEFYANPNNWKKSNVDNASKIHGDDVEHIVGMLLHRGGRRAREALKGE